MAACATVRTRTFWNSKFHKNIDKNYKNCKIQQKNNKACDSDKMAHKVHHRVEKHDNGIPCENRFQILATLDDECVTQCHNGCNNSPIVSKVKQKTHLKDCVQGDKSIDKNNHSKETKTKVRKSSGTVYTSADVSDTTVDSFRTEKVDVNNGSDKRETLIILILSL